MNSKVSIVKCDNYDREKLLSSVRKSLDLVGGISSFIKEGDKVLIKPNLLSATTPDTGVDTHPEFARAVIKIVKETGAKIYLGDGPSVWGRPQDVDLVYEKSGMKSLAYEEGVNLVRFNKVIMKSSYPFTSWVDECDRIISLPKFKTHDLMTLTGAIKNLFGLIPGLYKTELHRRALKAEDFSKILVDIYSIVKPTLSIVDGVVSMEGDGPASGGQLRNLGLIIASSDGVALDSVLSTIMGLKPEDILSTREAGRRGLGNTRLDNIEISGEEIKDLIIRDYKLPQVSLLKRTPKPFLQLAKGLFRFRVKINYSKCKKCQLCIKGCPVQAIELQDNKIKVNHTKCVLCLCCKEICPEGAVVLSKSIFARILSIVMRSIRWLLQR